MRHNVFGKKLGRDKDHRKALLRNLSASLILNGKIETTLDKAKFVRPYVEKLVTKAKKGTYSSVPSLRKDLPSKQALRALFSDVAPGFSLRLGGYTRIIKLGNRLGDNASMARIEWVEDMKKVKEEKEKKSKAGPKGRKPKEKGKLKEASHEDAENNSSKS